MSKEELNRWIKKGGMTEEEANHYLRFGAKSNVILKIIDLREEDERRDKRCQKKE
jgi:hypothetical protein